MKKILSLLLVFCFILSTKINLLANPVVVDTNIYLGADKLTFENDILNISGSTFYPMREVFNKLGVDDSNILWDKDTKTITVYANNTITIFEIDSNTVIENGEKTESSAKPFIYDSSTYLPIRPVAKACGYNVRYDEKTKTIYLSK